MEGRCGAEALKHLLRVLRRRPCAQGWTPRCRQLGHAWL